MSSTTFAHLSSDAVGLAEPKIAPPRAAAPPPASAAEVGGWFNAIYEQARGQTGLVPWAHSGANPFMIAWMNKVAPGLVRPGARVVVVGCGLGNDAAELACRGYDVTGFDIAPAAIDWARREHPEMADAFVVADAFDPLPRLQRRFDLVVECCTIQSIPPRMRADLVKGISSLLCPHGVMLAVCRGRQEGVPLESFDVPPYPLTAPELDGLMRDAGLAPIHPTCAFDDDCDPPVKRVRGAFKRA